MIVELTITIQIQSYSEESAEKEVRKALKPLDPISLDVDDTQEMESDEEETEDDEEAEEEKEKGAL